MAKIIWSEIDEAPALATYAFLPVVQAFTNGTGIEVETRDISLSGRVIANFPDKLTEDQKIPDYLSQLGDLVKTPEANVIKLPNISASIPRRATTSPSTPKRPRPKRIGRSRSATPRCSVPPSTRSCARAIQIVVQPSPSRSSLRKIPTK